MYIYCGKIIKNPICIHFLCGCKYEKDNNSDKRNVIAKYIDSKENNYSLILEKQFTFRHYNKMNINDLGEIELFASHYASTIIIIHETNSTAAEIALFGSKKELQSKILVIYPHKKVIEVNNIGAFLNMAYFKTNKAKKVSYDNFKSTLNTENKHVRYYMTNFKKNILDDYLKIIIDTHLNSNNQVIDISLKKRYKTKNINCYSVNRKNKKISVFLDYQFIFSIILAIICNKYFQNKIRDFDYCITNICYIIKDILLNTICDKEKIDKSDFQAITVKTTDKKDINNPIKFCVNILAGIGLLKFDSGKIVFSRKISEELHEYKNTIQEKKEKNFFEVKNGDNNE